MINQSTTTQTKKKINTNKRIETNINNNNKVYESRSGCL